MNNLFATHTSCKHSLKKLLHKNKKAGNLKLPKILLYILSKELKSKKELVQILALQAVSTSFTSATGNCL